MHPLSEFFGQNQSSSSQYGDDSMATKEAVKSGILADLRGIGGDLPEGVMTLIEALESGIKGEPIDDKKHMVTTNPKLLRGINIDTRTDRKAYPACVCHATDLQEQRDIDGKTR
jgi:hypothetical protein